MSFAAKGKKSIYKTKDKQTPHTVLQKLSPKAWRTTLKEITHHPQQKGNLWKQSLRANQVVLEDWHSDE